MVVAIVALSGMLLLVGWIRVRRARAAKAAIAPLMETPATRRGGGAAATLCRTVRVYFIKPSKYDDAGYVAYFWKGVLPNNTLTVLAALNDAYNAARADAGVYLETVIWDEQVDGPIQAATIRAIQEKAAEDGVEVVIGMSGVQTNQYPRGRDLALQFRRAGFPVLFGGFHVSGYPETRIFLEDCGITTVVGEAENVWAVLMDDYLRGELRPSYSVTDGIRAKTGGADIIVPLITSAQLPAISGPYLRRFASSNMTTLDTSRGCPFTCSYCSVKNVMGRTMRARDPEAVVRWIRDANEHHGIESLFIVDDDFFRSPSWEPILEGIAAWRREGHERFSFMMQVDAEAAAFDELKPGEKPSSQREKCERFLRLSAEAGCYAAFIGFETFNPQNLLATTKVQNLAKEHRQKKNEARGGRSARRRQGEVSPCRRQLASPRRRRPLRLHDRLSLRRPGVRAPIGGVAPGGRGRPRVVLRSDAAAGHRGPRQGGARGNDRRLGLQQLRLPAHGRRAPAHVERGGHAGVSRRVPDLLLGAEHAPVASYLAPGARPLAHVAECDVAPARLLLLQLPRRSPSDARRHLEAATRRGPTRGPYRRGSAGALPRCGYCQLRRSARRAPRKRLRVCYSFFFPLGLSARLP